MPYHRPGPIRKELPRPLTDEEMFGDEPAADAKPPGALTDEEMFADDGQPPALPTPPPLSDNDTWAGRTLRFAGLGMGFGDEVVGGISGAAEYVKSGFDSKRAAEAYRREQAKAEEISQQYEAENPWESTILDLGASAVPAGALFKGGQAIVRGVTGAKKLGAVGNALALGFTGAGAAGTYAAGTAPQSVAAKIAAAADPLTLAVGGGLGVAAGPLGGVGAMAEDAARSQ